MYSSKVYPDQDKFNTGDILLFHWRPRCNSLLDCCLTCYGSLIKCFTKSKYTHSAMIVKNPPWRKDLKGLYILESSLETFPDAENNELNIYLPSPKLSTDNAAMICVAAQNNLITNDINADDVRLSSIIA